MTKTDKSVTEFEAFWAELNRELQAKIGKTVGFGTAQDAFMALGPSRAADAAQTIADAFEEGECVSVEFVA
jgi:hypothetical protein